MATIKDVAKHAGVSIYTVSNVLNNISYLKEETRQKVLDSISELNYKPNYAGQLLRSQDTRNVAVSLPLLTGSCTGNDFFSQILQSIYVELNKSNYNLLANFSNHDAEVDKINFSKYNNKMITGMISTFTLADIDFLKSINYPIVAIDHKPADYICDLVITNNKEITKEAINIFIEKGHKKIGYIGTNYINLCQSNHYYRFEGFKAALMDNKLEFFEHMHHSIDIEVNDDVFEGYKAAEIFHKNGATAVFIDNTYAAIGFYQYARNVGLKIPKDIAVITFDDYAWQEISDPPMTVIKQPTDEIGKCAVRLLLARIENPKKKIEKIILPCEIIRRESV